MNPIPQSIDVHGLKSIAICRCVSKTWSTIIRRQDFTELFLSRSCPHPKLLLAYEKNGDLLFFSAPQNPDENNSFSTLAPTYHMKLSFDAYLGVGGAFQISGGLGPGLFGLTNCWFENGGRYSTPVICNPSTGQILPLTRVKTKKDKSKSFFGYDPIDKQVKLLTMSGAENGFFDVVSEEYQVMTLGTGKPSQRIINCDCVLNCYPRSEGICINGVLYYQAFEKSTKTYMLVCFDVRSEKFSFIKGEEFLFEGTMVNYNGKLGLLEFGEFDYVEEIITSVNLWVLEDIEKQEWSKHMYSLPAPWKDIVGSHVTLSFVRMMGTNEIVMESDPPSPLYLIYFNTERNTVVKVAIQGMDVSEYDQVHIFLDHVENGKCLGTS